MHPRKGGCSFHSGHHLSLVCGREGVSTMSANRDSFRSWILHSLVKWLLDCHLSTLRLLFMNLLRGSGKLRQTKYSVLATHLHLPPRHPGVSFQSFRQTQALPCGFRPLLTCKGLLHVSAIYFQDKSKEEVPSLPFLTCLHLLRCFNFYLYCLHRQDRL